MVDFKGAKVVGADGERITAKQALDHCEDRISKLPLRERLSVSIATNELIDLLMKYPVRVGLSALGRVSTMTAVFLEEKNEKDDKDKKKADEIIDSISSWIRAHRRS